MFKLNKEPSKPNEVGGVCVSFRGCTANSVLKKPVIIPLSLCAPAVLLFKRRPAASPASTNFYFNVIRCLGSCSETSINICRLI